MRLEDEDTLDTLERTDQRIRCVLELMREMHAQLGDEASDTFKVVRARGTLDALIHELANAVTPLACITHQARRGQR